MVAAHDVEGDLAASEAAYQRVLQIRGHDPDAQFGLGKLYLVKPDPASAAKAFRAAAHRPRAGATPTGRRR